jgi:hypothetical protein
MYCSNCGNQLPDGARFCRECGTAQSQALDETRVQDTHVQATETLAGPGASDAPTVLVEAPTIQMEAPTTQLEAPTVKMESPTEPPTVVQTPPPAVSRPAVIHTPPPPEYQGYSQPVPPAVPAPPVPPVPPVYSGGGGPYGGGGAPGGGGSSRKLWMIIACVGILVVALAIALPLILLRDGGNTPDTTSSTTTSVTAPPTSETTAPTTESTEPPTESTTTTEAAATTSSTPAANIPGDSAGNWAETAISGLKQQVIEVALSDDALVFHSNADTGPGNIYAYVFDSGKTVQLPTSGDTIGSPDIYGTLAVWWEANGADTVTDAHIYAYRLPNGPKVEVASGTSVAYPHVTDHLITWTEGKPWATQPDEWWENVIKAAAVDDLGQPTGASTELVGAGSAIASTVGDAGWVYSLSNGFVAWEQQTEAGAIAAGTYVMDLGQMQPWRIDGDAWRPSLYKNRVVFTRNGVEVTDFAATDAGQMDGSGDFATAGPTYAAYFKPKVSGDGTAWSVVAKGYTGGHEQVLLDGTTSPPWFQAPIAASAHRVAFAVDGKLHLFSWQQ